MDVQYRITGLGPLVFGDGRPFSNQEGSLNVNGLNLPYPSTLTGALVRPLLGAPENGAIPHLGHFIVRGPLLAKDGEVFYPRPLDGVPMERGDESVMVKLRPGFPTAGTDAPTELESLAGCNLTAWEAQGYRRTKHAPSEFLSAKSLAASLLDEGSDLVPLDPSPPLMRERRVGVGIDYETQSAERGKLYSTTGVYYATRLSKRNGDPIRREASEVDLRVMVSLPNGREAPDAFVFPFGGEKRYAVAKRVDAVDPFHCPGPIRDALAQTRKIKLVLATPAQFDGGWIPAWLRNGEESPYSKLRFRLVSACVGRKGAVSGWGQGKNYGPKPVTWLAPAGSVYFLELLDPPDDYADRLANAWLKAVSDDSRFRRNGFGLALWGTWREAKENN